MPYVRTKTFLIGRNSDEKQIDKFFSQITPSQILSTHSVQIAQDVSKLVIIYYDDIVPVILRTSPVDGRLDVPFDSDIIVYFSESIVLSNASDIDIRRNGSSVTGFTLAITDNILKISGAVDSSLSEYTVMIGLNLVTDTSGNRIDSPFGFSFSTSNALSGSTIVGMINSSQSIIDYDNVYPDPHIRKQIHLNFEARAREGLSRFGADAVISDEFFENKSDNPGGSHTPPNTTALVVPEELRCRSVNGTGVYYSPEISVPGVTGAYLEAAHEGSVNFKVLKDLDTLGVDILPYSSVNLSPAGSTLRLKAVLSGTGSILYEYLLYGFS